MNALKFSVLSVIALLLCGCEKEIDFDYHDIEEQQVIEGWITQDGVRVSLTKTVATDEPFKDNIVKNAEVTVYDMTDETSTTLEYCDDGYFTHPDLKGEAGHEYELNVKTGDKTYSSVSRMMSRSEILSAEFNWIKMPYDDVAVLKVQFKADEDPNTCYWMRVFRNGEIYEWQCINSYNQVDGIMTGMMMTSRKDVEAADEDSVLKEGDVVDIEVTPISRVMLDYLDSLNNGDYNGNIMFAGSYCLGYFLAANVSKYSIIYHPDQIPYAE